MNKHAIKKLRINKETMIQQIGFGIKIPMLYLSLENVFDCLDQLPMVCVLNVHSPRIREDECQLSGIRCQCGRAESPFAHISQVSAFPSVWWGWERKTHFQGCTFLIDQVLFLVLWFNCEMTKVALKMTN